jgi:hypothetical protein
MFNIVFYEFIESHAGDPTLRAFPLVDPIFDRRHRRTAAIIGNSNLTTY